MKSPLSRVIIATISGYLLVLLVLSVSDWVRQEYPRPPKIVPNSARIQHPYHHGQAQKALQHFTSASKSLKNAIRRSLKTHLAPLDRQLNRLDQSDVCILCLGEHHEESTRAFLAERFFPLVGSEVLMLEATPRELKRIVDKMKRGRPYFPMLGADILSILRRATATNPEIQFVGIDETKAQQQGAQVLSGSRENAVAHNFWQSYRSDRRHIVLFGALHCANEPGWLFDRLCKQAPPALKRKMVNVQVLGEHQNGPLEAFLFFLDEIGFKKESFAIADTHMLHPCIYDWFPQLTRQTLRKYRMLIVFRS